MRKLLSLKISIDFSPYNQNNQSLDALLVYVFEYNFNGKAFPQKQYNNQLSSLPIDINSIIYGLTLEDIPSEIHIDVVYKSNCYKRIGLNFGGLRDIKYITVGSDENNETIILDSIVLSRVDHQELKIRNLNVDNINMPANIIIGKLECTNVKFGLGEIYGLTIEEAIFTRVSFGALLFSSIVFKKASFCSCDLTNLTINNVTWP